MSTDIRYGRKRSGIKRQLNKKLEDWLDSIEDEATREAAKKDVIVTGGSIASMLLGEKINDYDLYFRTYDTTLKIALYYVKKFNERPHKTSFGYDHTPKVKLQKRQNIKGEYEDRIVVWMPSAGVASEEESEYRYFETLGEDEVAEFTESLITEDISQEKPKYRPVFMSENAITLSDSVQLIIRFYGPPKQIHRNYDFVHATCYYDYANGELVFPPDAMESLLSRTLIYRGSLYPVASIFRMKKFVERGWRITAGQQLKIMWQISEIDMSDYDILRDQLTGVDMAYMFQIVEALKDVERDKITSSYVAEIIDRIFE